jgi:hypothetical protein
MLGEPFTAWVAPARCWCWVASGCWRARWRAFDQSNPTTPTRRTRHGSGHLRQVGAGVRRQQGPGQGLRRRRWRRRRERGHHRARVPTRWRPRPPTARAGPGVQVRTVAGDITTPEGRAAALAACPQVDILVNNAGGPPPGDFRDWDRDAWIKALDANMLTPIELIKATVDAWPRAASAASSTSPRRGEGADRHPGPEQRRAQRPDRLRGRPGAPRLAGRNVTINACCPAPSTPTACKHHDGRRGQGQRPDAGGRTGRPRAAC